MASGRSLAERALTCAGPLLLQKKKWSKGKNKEKVNNAILFTKESFDKMLAEVPKFKMITVSILSDRLRINCSLARRALGVLIVRAHTSWSRAAGAGSGVCAGEARAARPSAAAALGLGVLSARCRPAACCCCTARARCACRQCNNQAGAVSLC